MGKRKSRQHVRLVAVIGKTSAGKSSFINAVLDEGTALVGDGSISCTRNVEQFIYKRKDGSKVTLVDTPGFNDDGGEGSKTQAEILRMIADFLETQYDPDATFSGVVFLHPITVVPAGITAENMGVFKRLCQLKNVVVVTTRWDEVCHSEEGLEAAKNSENSLMESGGLLKELNATGVRFLRAGHFSKERPQPAGDQYQSPIAVVESLLGQEEQPPSAASSNSASPNASAPQTPAPALKAVPETPALAQTPAPTLKTPAPAPKAAPEAPAPVPIPKPAPETPAPALKTPAPTPKTPAPVPKAAPETPAPALKIPAPVPIPKAAPETPAPVPKAAPETPAPALKTPAPGPIPKAAPALKAPAPVPKAPETPAPALKTPAPVPIPKATPETPAPSLQTPAPAPKAAPTPEAVPDLETPAPDEPWWRKIFRCC